MIASHKAALLYFLVSTLALVGCGGGGGAANPVSVSQSGTTAFDLALLQSTLDSMAINTLSTDEQDGLLWMREEEKLARDVYIALYNLHGLNIFNNISSSEQTHTDAVALLLTRYGLPDPAAGNGEGVFTDSTLQGLYTALVASGTPSLLDALYVGAEIEELDISDITRLENQVADNDDILFVYGELKRGSRNHLRAFYSQILNNGGSYTPKYITQAEFDGIVTSDMERN